MIESFIWSALLIGLSSFGYALSRTGVYNVVLLAQSQPLEFRPQDWANLGGFAVFAGAMYWMNRNDKKDYRDDLREDRIIRAKQAEALVANTAVTAQLNESFRALTVELRKST